MKWPSAVAHANRFREKMDMPRSSILLSVLTGLLCEMACPACAHAQFGGSGGGFGSGPLDLSAVPLIQSDWIESLKVIIAISDSGKTVAGYSIETGEWARVTVNAEEKTAITPVVAADFGVFVHRNRAYGFSNKSGKWAVIDLDGSGVPIVSGNHARVDIGRKRYMYSPIAGAWSMFDLAAD
jgi:hypothetical protein